MSYYSRLTTAALFALLIHVLILAFAHVGEASRDFERIRVSEPLLLNLQPPENDAPRRLVESTVPAEDIVRDTDLISNASSEARDDAAGGEPDAQPATEAVSDFDELAGMPSEPSPPVTPQAPAERSADVVEEANETAEEPVPQPEEPVISPTLTEEAAVSAELFEEIQPEPPAEEPLPEAFDVAQAPSTPMTESLGNPRSRESVGAELSGPLGFEANKHALGEYMLEVRRQVERTWRSSIQFKYSGTTQASALLECSIRPDGQLEHVKILERGESIVYAALCKQAIERAAPFGPFPFHVPEAYRSENLVIRWKFSYL